MFLRRGKTVLSFLFVLFLGGIPRAVHAGGAWVHPFNKYYLEAGFGYMQADSFFDRGGTERPNRLIPDPKNPTSIISGLFTSTYRQYSSSIYVEYGLPVGLEFVGSFEFYKIVQQDTNVGVFEARGIGDAVAGLKYKLFDREWLVLSGEVDVGIPSGDETAEGTVPTRAPQPLPLGDGEWDYAFRLLASRGFYPIPAYVTVDFGYRKRTSSNTIDYIDDLPWSVQGGYTFTLGEGWFPSVSPYLAFRGLVSTKNQSLGSLVSIPPASGVSPNQEFVDIQPGIFLKLIKGFALNTSFSYTFAGENTGASMGVRSGLTWEI